MTKAKNRTKDELLQRMPPFDLQAEIGVLGSIILLPDLLDDLIVIIRPNYFYDEGHQKLFEHMCGMHEAKKKIDPTLLRDRLQTAGDLETVGGLAYLSKIINAVPNAAHATYYAEIVREHFEKREFIRGATELLSEAYDPQSKSTDLVAAAEAFVSIRAGNACDKFAPKTIGEFAQNVVNALANPEQHIIHRTYFHIPEIAERVGSVNSGEICMVAARPSVGKTAFAEGLMNYSVDKGRPGLMVSLEMRGEELASREFVRETNIDSRVIRSGNITPEELEQLRDCQKYLSTLRCHIWDPPRATMAEISAVVKHAVKKLEITVACIDYIGLIAEPDKFKGTRREHLADCSRTLKRLAKECQIPIFVLCQLNRDAANAVPTMANLRECGAFEEDADGILLLHREDEKPDERLVIVEKFRNGDTGEIRVAWNGSRMKFQSLPLPAWEP